MHANACQRNGFCTFVPKLYFYIFISSIESKHQPYVKLHWTSFVDKMWTVVLELFLKSWMALQDVVYDSLLLSIKYILSCSFYPSLKIKLKYVLVSFLHKYNV